MEVITRELFSRNYEVIDFVLQFSTINNDKGFFFIIYSVFFKLS